MTPKPGDIYFAPVPGHPEPRRVVVVSREELNRGTYVVAVPVTSAKFNVRSHLPNCVPFRAGEFGFDKNCVAQAEQITFLRKSLLDLENGAFDTLDPATMRSLIHSIGFVIESDCEPEAS